MSGKDGADSSQERGEVRLLWVRRFQEAKKRHLSDNWVAGVMITALRFLLEKKIFKKKNLMNWNLFATQDQSGLFHLISWSHRLTMDSFSFIYLRCWHLLIDTSKKELNISTCLSLPCKNEKNPAHSCFLRNPAATAQNYRSVQWSMQKLFIILPPVRLQRNWISKSEEQITTDSQLTNNFLSASLR